MESIPDNCYPSNFFDPFGNEPTHSACDECGQTYENDDLTNIGSRWNPRYLCPICHERWEEQNPPDY